MHQRHSGNIYIYICINLISGINEIRIQLKNKHLFAIDSFLTLHTPSKITNTITAFNKWWQGPHMKRSWVTWWRHQMETFSALLAICAGNSPVSGEFPAQRPVTRSFGVFFDRPPKKHLSKQSWGWWFETLPRPLWRHSNVPWLWMPLCLASPGH